MSNLFLSPSSRLFNDLFSWDPWPTQQATQQTAVRRPSSSFAPSFEVRESESAFVFLADVPGVLDENVEITIEEDRLTISGKRDAETRQDSDSYHLVERSFGSFSRTFLLPEGADKEAIVAKLDNGVLTVTVAKRDKIKPRKIAIGVGAGDKQ